jgi:hypothetical protein
MGPAKHELWLVSYSDSRLDDLAIHHLAGLRRVRFAGHASTNAKSDGLAEKIAATVEGLPPEHQEAIAKRVIDDRLSWGSAEG